MEEDSGRIWECEEVSSIEAERSPEFFSDSGYTVENFGEAEGNCLRRR